MRTSLFLAVALAFLAGTQALTAQTKMIPEGWLPALSPSIKSSLNLLREANSQAEMNSLSRQVAEMTDAQLFIAYTRLYELLSAKERATLVTEQAKWLKARSKAAHAGIESTGGSLAPLEANNAEVTFTEKRLVELRARLKAAQRKSKKDGDDD